MRTLTRASELAAGSRAAVFTLILVALGSSACAPLPTTPERSINRRPVGTLTSLPASYAPGRVVVQVQDQASPQELAAAYASAVLAWIPEINLLLLKVPAGASENGFLQRLRFDPNIIFSELDYAAQTAEGRQSSIAFSEANRSWTDVVDQDAFTRVGVPAAHVSARGDGIRIAVLDTGLELTHPAFAGAVELPGIEPGAVNTPGAERAEGVDTNGDGLVDGALGHGTHVAGVILGVAPAAKILPVRVLDSDGVGYAFEIARGLVASVERNVHLANLSLGMTVPARSVEAAIRYAQDAGVVVVAPAGNLGLNLVDFPASLGPVLAVAGTDISDHKARFSNYGIAVDLAAPAVGILSTYVRGGYATWSGTSAATPFVTGVAALLYERTGSRSPVAAAEVTSRLLGGARPLNETDPFYGLLGAGRVDALGSLGVPRTQSGPSVLELFKRR